MSPHLCLGAQLARMELKVVFEELLPRHQRRPLDGTDRTTSLELHQRHQASADLGDSRMTRRPLIGLVGRRWPVERVPHLPHGALHGEEVDLHLSEYPKGISAVGGLPVQLTRDADPVDMISRLDGLVMTGGADPDPSLYGEDPHPELGEIEPGRDEWELALIRAALDRRLPMLCVCRGAQLLNIALGGTLVQHLDESDTHALWTTPRTDRCHTVQVSAGSRLASLYGADSRHQQPSSPSRRPPGPRGHRHRNR